MAKHVTYAETTTANLTVVAKHKAVAEISDLGLTFWPEVIFVDGKAFARERRIEGGSSHEPELGGYLYRTHCRRAELTIYND